MTHRSTPAPSDSNLDEQVLEAILAVNTSRADLMSLDRLRQRTWAVIGARLNVLTKRGALVSSKFGWRIART